MKPWRMTWKEALSWLAFFLVFVALTCAFGCRTAPAVHEFKRLGITVIVADSRDVLLNCPSTHNDRGEALGRINKKVAGCWKEAVLEIWVDWIFPGSLLHELCHADGQPDLVCDGVKWP